MTYFTLEFYQLQLSFVLFFSTLPALIRFHLKQRLILKYQFIHEGVPRPGKQNHLNTIYVAPQILIQAYGGVDPSHELQACLPSPFQVAIADTFVDLNDLFRISKRDGRPVRTVLTTGIPGIGLTVSVGKFCLDWAQLYANKVRTYFQYKRFYRSTL